jgi:hypothetical protein
MNPDSSTATFAMSSPAVGFPTSGIPTLTCMGSKAVSRTITPADKAAAARLKALWLAIPKDRRPTQQALADSFPGDANQSLISQYMAGRIALNYRAVRFFAHALGCPESAIRNDLPEQQLNAPKLNADGENFSRDLSQPAGISEAILHEALTLLLFDLDHGGPRSARSASDLLIDLYRRIDAAGGRLPADEQRAFEEAARARGQARGIHAAPQETRRRGKQ